MEHVTRSAYFSTLQSCMVRGAAYNWLKYTTLNEKFNVQAGIYPPAGVYPTLSYIAIGGGALAMDTDSDGSTWPRIQQHKSTDTALFKQMPFSLRTMDNDLPTEYLSRYGIRQLVQYNGTNYWAYWVKRVDFSQADTNLLLKQVLPDGTTNIQNFVPDETCLNPTPVDLSAAGTNLLAGYSILASTLIALPLDQFDINEICNASQIITGRTDRATISEFAICTGASKVVNVPNQNGTFPFNEAIGVQIASHVQALYPLNYINDNITDNLELGIAEPLFQLEGVNQ